MPPLPINDKQRPATLETPGSRLSNADSDGLPEDEGFYTRVDGAPPPIPQREVRPRSVGYGTTPPRPTHHRTLSKPLSPKLPLRHSLPTPTESPDQTNMRSSWSEPEAAPPLPPRGYSTFYLSPIFPQALKFDFQDPKILHTKIYHLISRTWLLVQFFSHFSCVRSSKILKFLFLVLWGKIFW